MAKSVILKDVPQYVHICIQIQPGPGRIRPQIPTGVGIVVAIEIVVQPCLSVVMLAGKPEVVFNASHVNLTVAKGVIDPRPDHQAVGSNELLWGAEVIVLVPVVGTTYFEKERICAPERIRSPAIGLDLIARCIILANETFIGV